MEKWRERSRRLEEIAELGRWAEHAKAFLQRNWHVYHHRHNKHSPGCFLNGASLHIPIWTILGTLVQGPLKSLNVRGSLYQQNSNEGKCKAEVCPNYSTLCIFNSKRNPVCTRNGASGSPCVSAPQNVIILIHMIGRGRKRENTSSGWPIRNLLSHAGQFHENNTSIWSNDEKANFILGISRKYCK